MAIKITPATMEIMEFSSQAEDYGEGGKTRERQVERAGSRIMVGRLGPGNGRKEGKSGG